MPTALTIEEHGEGIGDAWTVLRDNAARAGLAAPVPTCPGGRCASWWRTRAWCTAGRPVAYAVSAPTTRRAPSSSARAWPRPTCSRGWTRGPRTSCRPWRSPRPTSTSGSSSRTPPGPRQGWARRQCHETTIHAVDAMAPPAVPSPPAAETWIHAELAADGVDELLMGFVPRRRTGLELPEPRTVVVRTTDTRQAWTLSVGDGRTTSACRRARPRARPTCELTGHRGPGLSRPLEPRRRGRLHRPGAAGALAFGRAGALVARPGTRTARRAGTAGSVVSGRGFSSCCPSSCPPRRSGVDEVPLEDGSKPRREVVVAGLDHRRHPHDVSRRGQPDELSRRQRPS